MGYVGHTLSNTSSRLHDHTDMYEAGDCESVFHDDARTHGLFKRVMSVSGLLLSLQFSKVCTVIESRGTCQELSCSTVRITADLATKCSPLTGNIATKSWSMSDEWLTDGWPKCIPCLSASYHIDVREVVLS